MQTGLFKFGKWESGKRANWLTDEEVEALKMNPEFSKLFS
jgi:hypothetical protein